MPLSYSGGMFSDPGYLDRFDACLRQLPTRYDLRRPVLDPALGPRCTRRRGTTTHWRRPRWPH
ncbi:hypothetical protein ACXDF8_10230 [Mycolicibacterium sp. CBM1]